MNPHARSPRVRHRRVLYKTLVGVTLIAALALAWIGVARAVNGPPATVTARAAAIEATLRCPTCQGLSVADSPSPIAREMRRLVIQKVRAGRSAAQIRNYFVARYGDWILLSPPPTGFGGLVWIAPLVGLAGGGVLIGWFLRRRRTTSAGDQPDDAQYAAAEQAYLSRLDGGADPGTEDERLDAAIELLATVRADAGAGASNSAAEQFALRQVAAALAAAPCRPAVQSTSSTTGGPHQRRDRTPPTSRTGVLPPAEAGPTNRRRWWLLPAGLAAFAALALVVLAPSLAPRGANGVPTGLFAGQGTSLPGAADPAGPGPAVSTLRQRAAKHPSDPAVWLALGRALDSKGRLADAYTQYRKAVRLDPTNVEAQLQVASALIRGGSPDEAVPPLTALVRRHPTNKRAVLLLGLAQRATHDHAAPKTLRRYLRLQPTGDIADLVRSLLHQQ